MRDWNISADDPTTLILASDARLGATDYQDDQIWELSFGRGEASALTLQTTFGLRARACRIFPKFRENEINITDTVNFHKLPIIKKIYPNYIYLTFSPLPYLDVEAEYWVPQSHIIAGRFKLKNSGQQPRQIKVELISQLTPTEGGRMTPVEIQAAPVLLGNTENIYPLIFMIGGTEFGTGSFPSLTKTIDLNPGETKQITWIHTALESPNASFELARQTAARNWDSEITYLELLNSSQIEVFTGEPDWDIAFMLAQKSALSLVVGPTGQLPYPSFVINRQPDQGYSIRKDGSDYNHLWNGQPPIEAYYLSTLLLPGNVQFAMGFLANYLAIQSSDGVIDWKPGLAGQRSYIIATPILSSIALRIFEASQDTPYLEKIYPSLLQFVKAWLRSTHDRDSDGIPEWDHPIQSGLEEHPGYSRWHDWSRGQEIIYSECPSLNSFLYRECQSLVQIARLTSHLSDIPDLEQIAAKLKEATENAWDDQLNSYLDTDRDTHQRRPFTLICEHTGPGTIVLNQDFSPPGRLVIKIETDEHQNRRPRIIIHGDTLAKLPPPVVIQEDSFKWYFGRGSITSDQVFSRIEKIDVQDLDPKDNIAIYIAGHDIQDITQLLPLWAGIPDAQHAKKLIEETISNPTKYWKPSGLSNCANPPDESSTDHCNIVNVMVNSLVGEGLINYGYRHLAADLVQRLMNSIILNLKQNSSFRRYYHASTGNGVGEKDAVNGLAPLGLFLETLGVRILSPERVALSGYNPFPWPVTVKYRGLTVLRYREKTSVIFPDGQMTTIEDPTPIIVALK